MTLSVKSSLILGENKAVFLQRGSIILMMCDSTFNNEESDTTGM